MMLAPWNRRCACNCGPIQFRMFMLKEGTWHSQLLRKLPRPRYHEPTVGLSQSRSRRPHIAFIKRSVVASAKRLSTPSCMPGKAKLRKASITWLLAASEVNYKQKILTILRLTA